MKAILFELLGIALAILCIILAYVYWEEIKTGVGNFIEYLQEEKEERKKESNIENTELWFVGCEFTE